MKNKHREYQNVIIFIKKKDNFLWKIIEMKTLDNFKIRNKKNKKKNNCITREEKENSKKDETFK